MIDKRYAKIGIFRLPGIILMIISIASGGILVTKKKHTIVGEQGLIFASGTYGRMINGVSYQQDIVVTHKGYQYCGYYNKDRNVCLARRQLPDGSWKTIVFTDYTIQGTNTHNTVSIGICPNDGTIHLAFDHHNQPLHYRISSVNIASQPSNYSWTQSDTVNFSEVRDYLITGTPVTGVTYPRFFQTPEGKLQFEYRIGVSGNGDSYLADYEPGPPRTWKNVRCLIERSGSYTDPDTNVTTTKRNAYLNGMSYDKNGRLHTTWDWRSQGINSNHDLNYAYSDDRGLTWKNNANSAVMQYVNGSVIKKISVSSPGIRAWPLSFAYGQMNQLGQCVDNKGQVHVITYHRRAKGSSNSFADGNEPYFHYWRDTGGSWHQQEIALPRGNRPKVFADNNDNLIIATNVKSRLHLYAATAAKQWDDWYSAYSDTTQIGSEPLGDYYRFTQGDSLLSIFCAASSLTSNQEEGRPLYVFDFAISSPATGCARQTFTEKEDEIRCIMNHNKVRIQSGQPVSDVCLYTLTGKVLVRKSYSSAKEINLTFNVSSIAGSLCFIRINLLDGTSRTVYFVVKN